MFVFKTDSDICRVRNDWHEKQLNININDIKFILKQIKN